MSEPIVLYRTSDGSVAVPEDRCRHRFAPLPRGRLEGEACNKTPCGGIEPALGPSRRIQVTSPGRTIGRGVIGRNVPHQNRFSRLGNRLPDGRRYNGAWHSGGIQGIGTVDWPDARHYEGNFDNGKFSGHGTYRFASGLGFEGEFKDGVPDGSISFTTTHGDHYVGEFHNGHANGHGVMLAHNGARYEGEWVNGFPDGQGTLTRPDIPPFSGLWKRGCFQAGERSTAFGVAPSSSATEGGTAPP